MRVDCSTHVFLDASDPDGMNFLFCGSLENELLIPFHFR
jgi:hypothetical protein